MLRLLFISLAAMALTSCASSPRSGEESVTWQQRSDRAGRYIVVTVRNDPTSIDVRAGSSGRDYGGRGTYGAAPRARTDVKELSAKYSLSYVDAWPIEVLKVHCVVYGIDVNADMNEVMTRLRGDPRVESVQPLQSFSSMVDTTQNASAMSSANLQPNLQRMQVLEAHRVTRGAGVRVAVIDTGVDASHPDLKGRVGTQRDLVGNIAPAGDNKSTFAERHGTAVAGVIAAIADSRQGIVGVAPAATVLALRACWPAQAGDARAVCNTFTIAQALSAAIELRADVVNLSLAGPDDPLLSR
ncbi:MAG TPA: S8 family serine peptidase, partial [Steroidobacteraceae bacterium]|nr:S8 family serine peptidase [Steroidobacteraceae bacterium]